MGNMQKKKKERLLPFKAANYILFVIALTMILMGFVLLHRGSMTLAPILLVGAYCVVLPLSIMLGARQDEDKSPTIK